MFYWRCYSFNECNLWKERSSQRCKRKKLPLRCCWVCGRKSNVHFKIPEPNNQSRSNTNVFYTFQEEEDSEPMTGVKFQTVEKGYNRFLHVNSQLKAAEFEKKKRQPNRNWIITVKSQTKWILLIFNKLQQHMIVEERHWSFSILTLILRQKKAIEEGNGYTNIRDYPFSSIVCQIRNHGILEFGTKTLKRLWMEKETVYQLNV